MFSGCSPGQFGVINTNGSIACSPCTPGSYSNFTVGHLYNFTSFNFTALYQHNFTALQQQNLTMSQMKNFTLAYQHIWTFLEQNNFTDAQIYNWTLGHFYNIAEQLPSCSPCPIGSWVADSGAATCKPCANGFTTAFEGATSENQCVPIEGAVPILNCSCLRILSSIAFDLPPLKDASAKL